MWGWQRHFAAAVKMEAEKLLKALGRTAEVDVFLVGFSRDPDVKYPICIEPEDTMFFPSQFENVDARAAELYAADPESHTIHSVPHVHDDFHSRLHETARAEAVCEVLQAEHPIGDRHFSVGRPVLVDGFDVFVAIGIPQWVADSTPGIATESVNRMPVSRSLVSAAMDELIGSAYRALYLREPGRYMLGTLERTCDDMLRAAGERFIRLAIPVTGRLFAGDVFDAVNKVASMHYEKRVGAGRIVIVDPDHPELVITFSYAKPVNLNESRSFRKLLEMSGERSLALLSDGAAIYGVGSFTPANSNTEDAFVIRVEGLGIWTFGLLDRPLVQV